MAQLTQDQLNQYAQQAGFTGQSLQDIVAIAMAESGGNTLASNTVGNSAGTDRGVLQINSFFHPDVTDACAYDPACSFRSAFNISNQGTNFNPWVTFTSGAYKKFLSNTMSTFLPSCTDDPSAWYCQGEGETFGQSFNGNVERGNDLGMLFHTSITDLLPGTVTDVSYHGWGGQVGILSSLPGYGSFITYYQHLDTIDPSIQVGTNVFSGEQLGLSGGQLSGGLHPNSPQYSSGPHVEFGINAPWIAGIGQASNQSNFNSQFIIDMARQGKLPSGSGSPGGSTLQTNTLGSPSLPPNFWPQFLAGVDWKDLGIRSLLVFAGVILAVIGLIKFVS